MNLIGWGLFGLSSAVPISWTYILRRAGAGALRSSSSSSSGTPKDIITMLEKRIQLDEGRRGIQEIIIQGELYRAANELLTAKRVAIITGFPCLMDFTPPTETDGPLGALAIARSLLALGKEVIIVTDECNGEPLLAAVSASGLYGPKLQLECFAGGIGYDDGEAARLKEIGQKVDVVVAIERAGPSSDGKYKTMRGFDMSHLVAPLELLFRNGEDFDENDNSTEEPVLMKRTIGIGDGGNEVGMGKIYDKILASSISKAAEIACVVPSDHLIVASVSNWGKQFQKYLSLKK